MDDDRVDENGDDKREDKVGLELRALGNGPRDNGGSGTSKCPLEKPALEAIRAAFSSVVHDRLAEDQLSIDTNEAPGSGSISKHVADEPKPERGHRCI